MIATRDCLQVRECPPCVSTEAREQRTAIGNEEATGGLVLVLILEDVDLLQEQPEVIRERGARGGGITIYRPQLREHLADDASDEAAVARHIFGVDELQRHRSPRVGRHSHRHAIECAEGGRADRSGQGVRLLEQRGGLGEQRALAGAESGRKRGDERVDFRYRRSRPQERAQPLELALLHGLFGEWRILDRVEHAKQQVRERDLIAERRIELGNAHREAAADLVEPALVVRPRFHVMPPVRARAARYRPSARSGKQSRYRW